MPRTTSIFAILCACDRFETWKVIFEFTYCIKKQDLAPRPLKFALFVSPGDSSIDVRSFIMLLLWSEKEYALLTSNLLIFLMPSVYKAVILILILIFNIKLKKKDQ